MPNPFDIDQLNGVTFDTNALGRAHTYGTNTYDGNIEVRTVTGYVGGLSDPINPGMITVLSNDYTAGYYDVSNYFYVSPTFGSITFDGVIDTGTGQPKVFWIHGFSDNGLLLSTIESPYAQGVGAMYNQTWVLNNYGFSSATPSSGDLIIGTTFGIDSTVYAIPPLCFVEGTLIETVDGPVAVEHLSVGDLLVTASGARRPVTWIGEMVARPNRHVQPGMVHPVCVKQHAFGDHMPSRDLLLSPGHAVFVDGVLVPVGHLINGATIVQQETSVVRYFHVELETHDVLIAEGLPCESYLDDGNRMSFHNAGDFIQLHGRLDPKNWDQACAPMVADGPQLLELQRRLEARAEALGWVKCEEADLIVEADGAAIAPEHRSGNCFRFAVPAAESIVLRSNAAVLGQVMPGVVDTRRLGVALAELRVNGQPVDHDAAVFAAGFYPTETHDGVSWRWTDGAARLALAAAEPVTIELELAMVAPFWRRPADLARLAA